MCKSSRSADSETAAPGGILLECKLFFLNAACTEKDHELLQIPSPRSCFPVNTRSNRHHLNPEICFVILTTCTVINHTISLSHTIERLSLGGAGGPATRSEWPKELGTSTVAFWDSFRPSARPLGRFGGVLGFSGRSGGLLGRS